MKRGWIRGRRRRQPVAIHLRLVERCLTVLWLSLMAGCGTFESGAQPPVSDNVNDSQASTQTVNKPAGRSRKGDPQSVDKDQAERQAPSDAAEPGTLTKSHTYLSKQLETTVRAIDGFFATEESYDMDASTKSIAKLKMHMSVDDNKDIGFISRLNMRMDLPRTKRRLKLFFESDSDELEESENEQPQDISAVDEAESNSYFAGLRRVIKSTTNWVISGDVGVKTRIALDPFVRLKGRRVYDRLPWRIVLRQTFFHFRSTRFGSETRVQFNRQIPLAVLLRLTSKARWTDIDSYFFLSQSLQLYRSFSNNRAISFTTGAYGRSEPIHSTDYVARIRYRQRIHDKWLFIELGPEVLYKKVNQFQPVHLFWVGFEAVFGRRYTN